MTLNFKPKRLECFSYGLLIIVLFVSLYISYFDEKYFNNHFAAEDGFIEWFTALMLLASSITLVIKTKILWFGKSFSWKFGMITLVLLFFFAAGEEISWGQRIFNIESSSFFAKNNLQQETNLHNLTIGDVNINKLIFGKIIFVVLLIYILILPIIYLFYNKIQKLTDDFAVPIIQAHHALAFIISTLIIISIPAERKWEVYEFCFAFIFLMIFNNPMNGWIYKNKNSSNF